MHAIDRKDRARVYFATLLQIVLSILDLFGVALIGAIGALSINGIQSKGAGNRVDVLLSAFNLENFTFQNQVAILGLVAATVLIVKTVLSMLISRRILNFLSRRSAHIAHKILSEFLSQDLTRLKRYSQQEIIYASTTGVQNLTTGVIATSTNMIVDVSLLVLMFAGLALVSPTLAISILATFFLIATTLNQLTKVKAFSVGSDEMKYTVEGNEKIWEILNTYREATVRNTRDYYVEEISRLRFNVSNAIAQRIFMPYIGKYVMEVSIIIAALFVTGVQFYLHNATVAITGLTVFMAATTRIVPAILRLQYGAMQIRSFLGNSSVTIELLKLNVSKKINPKLREKVTIPFRGNVILKDISFEYEFDSNFHIKSLNLEIKEGEHVALVGPSGSGKTTLVDIILGVITPTSGSVTISGVDPITAFRMWPGCVSYIPQQITISNRSLRENILLGLPHNTCSDENILSSLEKAGLKNLLANLADGLDTTLGDNGYKLSGGQRQRIGIARALFNSPSLLIMDEATSALDASTEDEITKTLHELKHRVTIISIAHRLSTVRNADRVCYLNAGKIEAQGTFSEVRSQVPDFDKQANLMGL